MPTVAVANLKVGERYIIKPKRLRARSAIFTATFRRLALPYVQFDNQEGDKNLREIHSYKRDEYDFQPAGPTKGTTFATYSTLRQKNIPADPGELISKFVGLKDPSRYRRDDYANVPAPHGVSANRGGRTRRRKTRRNRK